MLEYEYQLFMDVHGHYIGDSCGQNVNLFVFFCQSMLYIFLLLKISNFKTKKFCVKSGEIASKLEIRG